jgi:predicted transcriptional regulator
MRFAKLIYCVLLYEQQYTEMFTVMCEAETPDIRIAGLLARITAELREVNEKLELLTSLNRKMLETQEKLLQKSSKEITPPAEFKLAPDVLALLSLPTSLRKTVMVLYKLEKATAEDIAKETKRLRAVESASANQLVRLGYLKKKREGRDVYFYIEPQLEAIE